MVTRGTLFFVFHVSPAGAQAHDHPKANQMSPPAPQTHACHSSSRPMHTSSLPKNTPPQRRSPISLRSLQPNPLPARSPLPRRRVRSTDSEPPRSPRQIRRVIPRAEPNSLSIMLCSGPVSMPNHRSRNMRQNIPKLRFNTQEFTAQHPNEYDNLY